LNADSTDYLGYGGFVSYNLFAYCENNPVSYFDYYGSFKGVYHYESTRDIAKKYFDKQYAKIIAEYAKKVDSLYPPINIYSEYCQSFHFNTNIGTKKEDSRIIRSEEFFFKAVEYLKEAAQIKKEGLSNAWKTYKFNNAIKNAFKYFGISIHPIQDLYAHSGSKGQKTGYIYINKYSNQQYISYSKMVVGSNIMQIGVFCHHCNNGNFDADDPSGKYLNTGRTKAFYSEAVTEIYMIAFAHYAEQYYKYVLLKY